MELQKCLNNCINDYEKEYYYNVFFSNISKTNKKIKAKIIKDNIKLFEKSKKNIIFYNSLHPILKREFIEYGYTIPK